jgi:hypothetical protein
MEAAVAIAHEPVDKLGVGHRALEQIRGAARGDVLDVRAPGGAEVVEDRDSIPPCD